MSWDDFYLICFLVGVGISFLSWLGGSLHFHLPHLPHFHWGGHMGGGHAGHGPAAGRGLGPINIGTIAAFLAWFGGTGYLLGEYHVVGLLVTLALSVIAGFMGAAILFWFLSKFLIREDEALDPADYDMIGVLGKVNSTVRPDGTGEMMFSQMGARRAVPVRSDSGAEIPIGTEVIVTRYERGIAYVRLWEELANDAAERPFEENLKKEK